MQKKRIPQSSPTDLFLAQFLSSSPSLSEECIKSLLIKFVDDIKVKSNKDSLVLQTELNDLIRLDFSERNPF